MKKNIGAQIGLYPTPLAVVGATVNGKTNWVLVGHLGIMGHDRIMISLSKSHYTNRGIKENGCLSVNLVDENLLPYADYVGCVSGSGTDKSKVFDLTVGITGAPMIADSP
ncbi:MAG: flavin reductase family protein, partial [Candidatus Scatosoma sp.]